MRASYYSYSLTTISLLFSVAIILAFLWHGYSFTHDDAFISYRYAQNFALGRGLVFNLDERIFGFTSPLQVLTLCLVATLGLDLPTWCFALSVLWIALSVIQLFYILRRFFSQAIAFSVCIYFLTCGIGYYYLGLESALLILIQLVFLNSLLSNRPRGACLLAALACLTRPDSVLLVIPALFLAKIWRKPTNLIFFILPEAAWLIFAYSYYGSIVPHSFYAKAGASPFWPYLEHIVGSLLYENYFRLVFGSHATWILTASLSALNLKNKSLRKRPYILYAIAVYPWSIIISYSIIRPNLGHDWELASAYYFFRLGVLTGLAFAAVCCSRWILCFLQQRPYRLGHFRQSILNFAIVTITAVVFFNNTFQSWKTLSGIQSEYWYGGRHATYVEITDWMKQNLPRQSSVAVVEPGTIAYLSDLQIVDLPGIVTEFDHARGGPSFPDLMMYYSPEYLLLQGTVPFYRVNSQLSYEQIKYFASSRFVDHSLLKKR